MPDLDIRISAKRGDETKTSQIFNQIASAILAGKFDAGDEICSERALAERLGVSRNVVRGAYRRLEEEGLIETVSTSGRRVRCAASGNKKAMGAAGIEHDDRVAMGNRRG
ncbi:MAG TPA: winged helix-turn-helix domain-containing protein [Pyrinomonadaceae bacterium]|nr:winged helix-turn-helix domain-containing protein [Pyrinomonadaceae bacterium]